MVITDVLARVTDLVESSPFRLVATDDPFSFDQQAQTAIDGCYRVDASMTGREGYLGMQCAETWSLSVWMGKAATRRPVNVRDALTDIVSRLSAAIERDAVASGEYAVVDAEGDVQWPEGSGEYLVGRVGVQVEFDRAL